MCSATLPTIRTLTYANRADMMAHSYLRTMFRYLRNPGMREYAPALAGIAGTYTAEIF